MPGGRRLKDQVLKSLGPAAAQLRQKLGESLNMIKSFDKPVENVTTSSLEALRQYTHGVDLHSQADYEHAIEFYKKAIQNDPDFASAHTRLALCYNNNRQYELAREEYTRAYELRDRVSEREKFEILANYYGGVTGEWEQQIKQLEMWKQTYPRDWEPLNLLCNKFTLVGPFERAVTEGHAATDLNPKQPRAYVNLAVAFMGQNKFDEAIKILRQAAEQKLESANMHQRLYHMAFVQGDADTMKEQIEWTRTTSKIEDGLNWQAQVAAFSGKLTNADELNERMIRMNSKADGKEFVAQVLLVEAIRDATLGNCERATRVAKQALDLSREHENVVSAANAYATCGQAGPAQSAIDELLKMFPLDTLLHSNSVAIIRAQLELSRGNAPQAVQALESARKYEVFGEFWPQYLRGQAYLKEKDGAKAAIEFKTIIDHRGWYPVSPLYPLAQLGLARAAALNGDNATARTAYLDFLKLWKDADSNLPALVAARAEYEKLK